jgi:hypothetical protein
MHGAEFEIDKQDLKKEKLKKTKLYVDERCRSVIEVRNGFTFLDLIVLQMEVGA